MIGDLQGTLTIERLIGREQNRQEARGLLVQLGRERAGATVLLGDLVTWGASTNDWQRYDELAGHMTGILVPVRGNHDYFGSNASADAQWQTRFPWFARSRWYSLRWGSIGMAFLDSNIDELSDSDVNAECDWYAGVLAEYDHDPLIRATLVFLHHAPYTMNPNAQGGLQTLRKLLVEPFCRHEKTLAMIAGHAHGYERYAIACGTRTAQFIVSGGGGGPRPTNPPCYNDQCLASGCCEPSARPLHYLLIQQWPEGLSLTVVAQRTAQWDGVLENVWLPFPEKGRNAEATSSCNRTPAARATQCPRQASPVERE